MVDLKAQLTGKELASRIDEAITSMKFSGDTIQISLWFGGVADRGEYAGRAVGVTDASVKIDRFTSLGFSDCNHIEFNLDIDQWLGFDYEQKINGCWVLIDFALKYSANDLAF